MGKLTKNQKLAAGTFGLKQMTERLAMINGKVAYDGHHGFLTIVTIPLQEGELYD